MKNKVRKLFYFIFVLVIFEISFNALIDPYLVLNHSNYIEIKNYQLSDRISKFYLYKYKKPKNIMIGTSRVGCLDVISWSRHVGQDSYNGWLGTISATELYHYFEYYTRDGNVKNVFIGLDLRMFDHDNEDKVLQDKHFSQARLQRDIYLRDFKNAVFGYNTFTSSVKTMYDNMSMSEKDKYDHYDTGNAIFRVKYECLQKGKCSRVSLIKETLGNYSGYEFYRSANYFKYEKSKLFDYLIKIDDLAHQRGVNVVFATMPLFKDHQEMIDSSVMTDYLCELQKRINFYHFNYYNTFTRNSENFIDSHHLDFNAAKDFFNAIYYEKCTKESYCKYIIKEPACKQRL